MDKGGGSTLDIFPGGLARIGARQDKGPQHKSRCGLMSNFPNWHHGMLASLAIINKVQR